MIAKFFITALLIYGVFLVFLFFYQRNMIYFPDTSRPDPAAYGVPNIEIAKVQTDDGLALEGWYWPPATGKPVIVYFHGNASHFANRLPKVVDYINAGYGILLTEYRGYGGNPGRPTEQGIYSDARAFLRWLADEKQVPLSSMIFYGESIGSGPAVQMATERTPAALILEAPFTAVADIARRTYFFIPVDLLLRDRYHNISKISAVKAPLLIVAGEADNIIAPAYSRALFDAANDPRYYVSLPGAGHNDMTQHGLAAVVLEFLGKTNFQ
jgi:fermentation-respiration switch protein FrsA (DUF1100 family)